MCKKQVEEAKKAGKTTSYGCLGFYPLDKPIPWESAGGRTKVAPGRCTCDNPVLNEFAETYIEAAGIIGQVCFDYHG